MEKICYIIRGVPGSGKSTLAGLLTTDDQSIHEADSYMVDDLGNYAFDPTRLAECHAKCYEAFCADVRTEVTPVVVSNTSTKYWEYAHYVAFALQSGYNVIEVTMSSQFTNTHGCDISSVQRFKERFQYPPIDLDKIQSMLGQGLTPLEIQEYYKEEAFKA